MGKSLVIVESPAKAKTLARILGSGYTVAASYGHVRDLPGSADQIPAKYKKEKWARLGVDVDNDFEPLYIVSADKKRHIQTLKKALAGADEVLLATDEDREGESISWHVLEVLKPAVPVRRIAFHEITEEAIRAALESPRDIDLNLVRAQESRRILDRLFGYQLSPVLWKKVRPRLSAGRVQSVAVRLCVLRERDRRRFRRAVYWDVEAELEKDGKTFRARLARLGDAAVASGQDFDADTGKLKPRSKALWLDRPGDVADLIAAWRSPWTVTAVAEKPFTSKPAPPFTTSSLQQEANRKLRFAAKHTMRVAQRLYEGVEIGGERVGLITYMRTDSLALSNKALKDAQQVIRERYGAEFTNGPRRYKTKSKGAQEAHEAIRPSELARTPEAMKRYLTADEAKIYELIWKRTVASQMTDARLRRTSVEITAAGTGPSGVFAATGKTIEFPGFLRAYVEGADDPETELADREIVLPAVSRGEAITPVKVEPSRHETQPPARYTEASLIKELESDGIGRPSTYASIIDTIQDRGYVEKQGNALVPTFTAHAVTQLLEKHFADYVDTKFTARMEEQLDDIAEGQLDWLQHLRGFYFGHDGDDLGLERRIAIEEPRIDFPSMQLGRHPESGEPIVVRVGRYGPYLQHKASAGDSEAASLPAGLAPADLSLETAVDLLRQAAQGNQKLGRDPESGETVFLCRGRFGPYVQLGETPEPGSKEPKPKRASLPAGLPEEQATLEQALRWLALPRILGVDPNSGEQVVAAAGRFGPYIKRGADTRSLTAADDVYSVHLARALELLDQPKSRGRRSRTVLKEFPDGLQVLEGRYGPYLTNGKLNASLPRGVDPAALTAEAAGELLAERGKPPKSQRKQ
ncbi:MAG: type I DNA topoisomerase [Acidobacteriota bacterium]|nr:type I DNA topoisomerase [Acidobacteriota bacterium]MDH3523045.1 type I DNA topoisomerase [Acidobacteriota bacterium]